MPAPRVFISSTCYDLKYIRENLRFFVRNLGYEPVLSEDGAVFYDPKLHVADACVAEVPICQLFVLIIGGRYGSLHKGKSITNSEYDAAVKAKLPIFALVERDVLEQSRVYAANKGGRNNTNNQIVYPAVDNTLVFDFIEDVQAHAINNALVPFSDFEEMQAYLKRQWASMLHQFLTTESEAKRVGDILQAIAKSSDKVEYFTRQLVAATGDRITKLKVDLYDYLLKQNVVHDLVLWNLEPSHGKFLQYKTLDELCDNQIEFEDDEDNVSMLTYGGPPYRASEDRVESNRKRYLEVRAELLKKLEAANVTPEEFLRDI
jgi:Domain of unknown function (DUF4062)